jgi:hypothetical protein
MARNPTFDSNIMIACLEERESQAKRKAFFFCEGTYEESEFLPLIIQPFHRLLPDGFVHDAIYPHFLQIS